MRIFGAFAQIILHVVQTLLPLPQYQPVRVRVTNRRG